MTLTDRLAEASAIERLIACTREFINEYREGRFRLGAYGALSIQLIEDALAEYDRERDKGEGDVHALCIMQQGRIVLCDLSDNSGAFISACASGRNENVRYAIVPTDKTSRSTP